MRERPILMSGPMVRALLDGTKTQSRRLVAGVPAHEPMLIAGAPRRWVFNPEDGLWRYWELWDGGDTDRLIAGPVRCPYGVPGDRLWVRETWGCKVADSPGVPDGRKPQPGDSIQYAANDADAWQWRDGSLPWRPSIHMPRWASRLTLELTNVRVQRVQDISEEDAVAEGMVRQLNGTYDGGGAAMGPNACHAYMRLWDSLNASRGYTWESNPWVWCLSFKKVPGEVLSPNHPVK